MSMWLEEVIRWFVMGEMIALIWCTYLLHAVYSEQLPKRIRWMGRGMLYFTAVGALAIGANATADEPVTIGVYIVAALILPVVIVGSVVTTHVIREGWQQHQAFKQAAADIAGLEPCPNPDCIDARAHLQHLARLK